MPPRSSVSGTRPPKYPPRKAAATEGGVIQAAMRQSTRPARACAMPPVSWPTASIFWLWRSAASARSHSTTSSCKVAIACCSSRVRSATRASSVSFARWAAWNRCALSIADAAWPARPTTTRSAASVNTPGSGWPKNKPPSTVPLREMTGTAR